MHYKLIDIRECAFEPNLVLDSELKVVSVIELEDHEEELEIPAKLSTPDVVLLFEGSRGDEELRDVGDQRCSII